ncbi:MAG: hypothetical protein M1831_001689 [Alyxoria varia]|nr:MAG: hypothetical protein M1831_001689 [Alyxoria varia]
MSNSKANQPLLIPDTRLVRQQPSRTTHQKAQKRHVSAEIPEKVANLNPRKGSAKVHSHQLPSPPINLEPTSPTSPTASKSQKSRQKKGDPAAADSAKRRCCDGNTPACAACSSVYGTECVYDPNSDHRRKGVYKQDIDNLKTRNSTLQTLIQAILNYPQQEVPDLITQIRTCESLDQVADIILSKGGIGEEDEDINLITTEAQDGEGQPSLERHLANRFGNLRLESGSTRFLGATSTLIHAEDEVDDSSSGSDGRPSVHNESPATSWTTVTDDSDLIRHLLKMYFTWHYTFFTILTKKLFKRDFKKGRPSHQSYRKVEYCTPLLVNAMLALGCHFSASPAGRADPSDPSTAGDHFFKECKRLIMEDEEYEHPRLATVQALALMSVREAGCGREAKGWAYSGISFRMACDLGLNLDWGGLTRANTKVDPEVEDARRTAFWGCYLIDKCWSNYLGRLPQFQHSLNITVPKYDVFPEEEAENWSPYTDSGVVDAHTQPCRLRTVALQISALCDISSDIMKSFYHPQTNEGLQSNQAAVKRLRDLHGRLENWKRELPKELEAKEGCLSSVLHMHMFFQILYIHLFRPFLQYNPQTSPLPASVSPRRFCTLAANTISKLLRQYKRAYGLRQICNIVVYILHSACTIHLLNLPDKNAKRDIVHGVKQLEEIAEGWPCAGRALSVLSAQARSWKIELPEEASVVLDRTDVKFGTIQRRDSQKESPVLVKGVRSHEKMEAQLQSQQEEQELQSATTERAMWDQPMEFDHFGGDVDLGMFDWDGAAAQQEQNASNMAFMGGPEVGGVPAAAYNPYMQDQSRHTRQSRSASTSTLNWDTPTDVGGSDQYQTQPVQYPPVPNTSSMQQPVNYQASMPPPSHFDAKSRQPNNPMTQPPFPSKTHPKVSTFQQPPLQQPLPSQPPHVQTRSQPGHANVASFQQPPQASDPPPSSISAQESSRISASHPMFGGIGALLNDANKWVMKDQTSVANGFGNWDAVTAPSEGPSPSPATSPASARGAPGSTGAMNAGRKRSINDEAWFG